MPWISGSAGAGFGLGFTAGAGAGVGAGLATGSGFGAGVVGFGAGAVGFGAGAGGFGAAGVGGFGAGAAGVGFGSGFATGAVSAFTSGLGSGFTSGSDLGSGFGSGLDSGFTTGAGFGAGFGVGLGSGLGFTAETVTGAGVVGTGIGADPLPPDVPRKRNTAIISLSTSDWLDNSSAAAAVSSDVEELRCITSAIWLVPVFTCEIASACSLDSTAIPDIMLDTSSVSFTIFSNACAVAVAMAVPWFTFSMDSSIIAEVSLAATSLLVARLRTSSATTAKPFP